MDFEELVKIRNDLASQISNRLTEMTEQLHPLFDELNKLRSQVINITEIIAENDRLKKKLNRILEVVED
ncbi:MAG: hypothetical protein JRJ62_01555 [Deltaproteobacteria bacterium]|nr:hypothetical protein [Deltaproteobacteria bacterium]